MVGIVDFGPRIERQRLLTAKDAAAFLGISLTNFRRGYWEGRLPQPVRISERRLGWRVQELIDFVDELASTE